MDTCPECGGRVYGLARRCYDCDPPRVAPRIEVPRRARPKARKGSTIGGGRIHLVGNNGSKEDPS